MFVSHFGIWTTAYHVNQAYTFLREFVLGNNSTGLVTNSSGSIVVVGGENSTLAENILPGQAEIYYGSGTTQSTYTFPSATVAAWNSFIRTETATSGKLMSTTNSGHRIAPIGSFMTVAICVLVLLWMKFDNEPLFLMKTIGNIIKDSEVRRSSISSNVETDFGVPPGYLT